MLPALLVLLPVLSAQPPPARYAQTATACAPAGADLVVTATFSADFPNRVRAFQPRSGAPLGVLSNQAPGPQLLVVPDNGARRCVALVAEHRVDGYGPWAPSQGRFRCTEAHFEDSTDADYNDAAVLLQGATFRGLGGCAEPLS